MFIVKHCVSHKLYAQIPLVYNGMVQAAAKQALTDGETKNAPTVSKPMQRTAEFAEQLPALLDHDEPTVDVPLLREPVFSPPKKSVRQAKNPEVVLAEADQLLTNIATTLPGLPVTRYSLNSHHEMLKHFVSSIDIFDGAYAMHAISTVVSNLHHANGVTCTLILTALCKLVSTGYLPRDRTLEIVRLVDAYASALQQAHEQKVLKKQYFTALFDVTSIVDPNNVSTIFKKMEEWGVEIDVVLLSHVIKAARTTCSSQRRKNDGSNMAQTQENQLRWALAKIQDFILDPSVKLPRNVLQQVLWGYACLGKWSLVNALLIPYFMTERQTEKVRHYDNNVTVYVLLETAGLGVRYGRYTDFSAEQKAELAACMYAIAGWMFCGQLSLAEHNVKKKQHLLENNCMHLREKGDVGYLIEALSFCGGNVCDVWEQVEQLGITATANSAFGLVLCMPKETHVKTMMSIAWSLARNHKALNDRVQARLHSRLDGIRVGEKKYNTSRHLGARPMPSRPHP
eukprot:TRINITY_DN53638_c0_g2_i1.p1 TRINITY_DN53638_c0_g2~~TRINITY_DN53638_c0_g2_i1.p1  ORF type:complete len:592 (-),score=24.19 TRINITY_DN53638_c0_g2_i1:23-1558(-)